MVFSVIEKKPRHREVKTLAQVPQPPMSGAEAGSWAGLAPELLEHSHQWGQNLKLAIPKASMFCGHPLGFPSSLEASNVDAEAPRSQG